MLINKISISNFLCYYGSDNQFAFVEGLNIVLGANGYGKSKLYDAFQWVFSDAAVFCGNTPTKGLPTSTTWWLSRAPTPTARTSNWSGL